MHFAVNKLRNVIDVPVLTGFLRRSMVVEPLVDGIRIAYRSNYASDVESGREAKLVIGTFKYHIKQHRRRNKNGSYSIVAAHDMTLVNKKIIEFRPKITKFERGEKIVRIISEEPAQEGQHYLGRAKDKELPFLADDIASELKKLKEGSVT